VPGRVRRPGPARSSAATGDAPSARPTAVTSSAASSCARARARTARIAPEGLSTVPPPVRSPVVPACGWRTDSLVLDVDRVQGLRSNIMPCQARTMVPERDEVLAAATAAAAVRDHGWRLLTGGAYVWFQQMSGSRPQRNRVHFDLTVGEDEAELRVAAVLAAGGRLVSDAQARAYWVLADPEGNEVCICTWQDRD
jgi:hypothetical protein